MRLDDHAKLNDVLRSDLKWCKNNNVDNSKGV